MRAIWDAFMFGVGSALVCHALGLSLMCAMGITLMGVALIRPDSERSK